MSVKSKFTAIADEIRTLSNSTNNMDLNDILNTLNEANTEVANQTDLILQIIEEIDYKTMDLEEKFVSNRAFKTYTNSTFQSIGNGAFTYCSKLTSVNFPNCTTIGYGAFQNCFKLTSVSFPNCTTINTEAFYYCTNLTSVSFPNCTYAGNGAFSYCTKLTSISFPKCTDIGYSAFQHCSKLISASFPNCTTIGSYAFAYCYSLTTVDFPNCTTIGSNTFINCSKLTSVSFPNCISIGSSAFRYCYRLSQLYLTGSSVCKLFGSNAFNSTPFTGYSFHFSGTPYIYVPESLVTSYQNATNWTYFSSYISFYNE